MQRLKPVLLLLCLLMATSRCVADDSTHVQIQYDTISNGRSSHWDIQQQFSFCLLGRFGMRQFDSALSGFLGPATVI